VKAGVGVGVGWVGGWVGGKRRTLARAGDCAPATQLTEPHGVAEPARDAGACHKHTRNAQGPVGIVVAGQRRARQACRMRAHSPRMSHRGPTESNARIVPLQGLRSRTVSHTPVARHWRCGAPCRPGAHVPTPTAPAAVTVNDALPTSLLAGQKRAAGCGRRQRASVSLA
jgi:hypothetical protein